MQPFAHVTVTVKFETAAVVGVPESRPPGASVIPAGRLPALTVKVKGGVPALAVRVWLYDTPVVAPGSEAGRTAIVVPWIGTVAAGPALAATGTFEQSRALTVVTVSVPLTLIRVTAPGGMSSACGSSSSAHDRLKNQTGNSSACE